MTLTILRKNKNTTTTIFSVQLTILGLLKDPDRKDYDHGRCKEICPVEQEPQYIFRIFSGKRGVLTLAMRK